ncbi:MAG: T9SS type A sorting domain-containing protein, partial [Cytophagales bacterium]|nr:T9SS type A sorting domain-containing protein [Cytophagales bacterium]
YRFYKAINFAGPALTIDGRNWQAGATGGYSHNGKSFTNKKTRLSPATDDDREQMIRSAVWHHKQLKLTLTNLPPAAYRVYLYTWEDNLTHTYSLALEGQTVVSNRSSGAAGTWKKLGPFEARISDGTLRLTTTGHVNISGVELWKEEITNPVTTCAATGTILRELWTNVQGRSVSDIPLSRAPTATSQLTSLETPADRGDNYGTRVRGYVCPPATGNYTFWIAGDDESELWLSTNDKPAGKVKIAHTYYTAWREWTKYASQRSASIYLEAGKKYYLEVLHKEAAGRDGVSVGWQLPNGTLERPIPGSRLSPYAASAARTDSQPEDQAQEVREAETARVFPNPADEQVTFTFTAKKQGPVDVAIYGATGREVKRIRVEAQPGSTTVVIPVADLAPGFYFIRGGSGATKKLVIDR